MVGYKFQNISEVRSALVERREAITDGQRLWRDDVYSRGDTELIERIGLNTDLAAGVECGRDRFNAETAKPAPRRACERTIAEPKHAGRQDGCVPRQTAGCTLVQ